VDEAKLKVTQTNQPEANVKAAPTPIEEACARLKSAGMRLTRPRLAILGALIGRNEPASIEQIHAGVRPARCDLVTIYRSLAAFEEIQLVRRTFFLDRVCRFQIDLGKGARYRVVCPHTYRVGALDEGVAAGLSRALLTVEENLRAQGYTEISHRVEFFGSPPTPPQ